MAYTELTQYNSPNYTPNAQVAAVFGLTRSIDFITIHWWGDPSTNPSFEGVVAWLCNPRSQVSAHDVVSGTGARDATLVAYLDAAWHAGSAQGNTKSIGIECDPRCRNEDYDTVAQVIADLWVAYGKKELRRHSSWISTQCPGNYDLGRLAREAQVWYDRKTGVAPTATEAQVRQAYLEILEREADAGGLKTYTTNGMTVDQVRADLMASQERKILEAKKAAEYAKLEWVRNLQPYTSGDINYSQTVKLSVVPADGVKVTNLETNAPLNDSIIPKGTQVDVVAKTTVKGVLYLISSYSKNKGMANGIVATALAVPAIPPVQEKPEWLKNLSDIADKDFWTRSETPVLKLADGSVSRTLPINSKVRITHATQIVGINLLVVEGQTEGIETVYLSDTPITNPDDDLKERIAVLEVIVAKIVEFLSGIFKNFSSK